MKKYDLPAAIIAMSASNDWDLARLEWKVSMVERVERADLAEQCLCGHYPIMELCHIHNDHTNHTAVVGNCCVKKFMGIDLHLVFDGLKRIMRDDTAALNDATVDYCYSVGVLTDWEYEFCKSIKNKRNLSMKQTNVRRRVNQKVLALMVKKKPQVKGAQQAR